MCDRQNNRNGPTEAALGAEQHPSVLLSGRAGMKIQPAQTCPHRTTHSEDWLKTSESVAEGCVSRDLQPDFATGSLFPRDGEEGVRPGLRNSSWNTKTLYSQQGSESPQNPGSII
jgi:hypothetical protein